jgi:hypothetical protein
VAAGILINIARQERSTPGHGIVHMPHRGRERTSTRSSAARGRGR